MDTTKYIRGHESRGHEILNLLLSMGGENKFNVKCSDTNSFYYIDIAGVIRMIDTNNKNIKTMGTEIFLADPINDNIYLYKGHQYTMLETIKGRCCNDWEEYVVYSPTGLNDKYTISKREFDKLFTKI